MHAGFRKDHGSPISRERIYIVLIKKELMLQHVKGKLQRFGEQVKQSLHSKCTITWYLVPYDAQRVFSFTCWRSQSFFFLRQDLLLPRDHPDVQDDIQERKRNQMRRFARRLGLNTRNCIMPSI